MTSIKFVFGTILLSVLMMFQLTQSSTIPASYYLRRNLPDAELNVHAAHRVKFGKRAGRCVPKTITSSYAVSTATPVQTDSATITSSVSESSVTTPVASSSSSFDYDKWLSEMMNWPASTVWIT